MRTSPRTFGDGGGVSRRDHAVRTANEANAGAGGLRAIDAALADNSSAMAKPRTGKSLKDRINSVLDSAAPGMDVDDYEAAQDQFGDDSYYAEPQREPGRYPLTGSRAPANMMPSPGKQLVGSFGNWIHDTPNNRDAAEYQRSVGITVHDPMMSGQAEVLPSDYQWQQNGLDVTHNLAKQRNRESQGGSRIGGGWD